MTRYGKIFLLLLAIGVLAWILPWLYSFATPDTRYAPFTLMSEVNDQLLHNLPADEKGLSMIDQQGRVYSGEAIDSMLPTFYYRQLIADGRLPDTLRGVAMTPKAIQAGNFIFRSSPSDLNRRVPGLYPLLESRSGRVDLEMPDDVFRITDQGIEFIDMATNTIKAEKSRTFTLAMEKKGFAFPATAIAGNPTTRKDYDNGYLLIVPHHRVFPLVMGRGRPFVRDTGIDPQIGMVQGFVTEFPGRQYIGYLTDRNSQLYVLTSDYELIRMPVGSFDPKTENLMIVGNLFNRTVRIGGDDSVRWYGLRADVRPLVTQQEVSFPPSVAQKIAGWVIPFRLSFTSSVDGYAYPRFEGGSPCAFVLGAVLAGAWIAMRRKRKRRVVLPALVILATGVYGFLAFLLLKVPENER